MLSTGGTIASRTDDRGVTRAQDSVSEILARVQTPPGVTVAGEDVERVGSYALTLADMAALSRRITAALRDPEIDGVVVTHGTDTLEASAFLAQLVHDDRRPVVFTGAMRAADVRDSDGPRNLTDAIAVAASPEAQGLDVVVVFDGEVLPAVGVRKMHTVGTAAFGAPETGRLGQVHGGALKTALVPGPALRARVDTTGLRGTDLDLDGVRVDIVASYPGADGELLHAAAAAGARGIVLEGTGAGNATPEICKQVSALVDRGVVVAVTTRVLAGPVTPVYGNGGGADLVAAGAVPLTWLRAPQALVLLASLLATGADVHRINDVLTVW
ncbi:MAG: asparaginase [Actinomycetota bacterium]